MPIISRYYWRKLIRSFVWGSRAPITRFSSFWTQEKLRSNNVAEIDMLIAMLSPARRVVYALLSDNMVRHGNLLRARFIRPVARVGSGDPVRVLRLYTTNTLDEVCSIYCWDICTTCRYQSMCYSTGASGPTALSVCSRLWLVANCLLFFSLLSASRTVLYDAFYSYLCRRYWNGILGPSSPPLPGESFDTCSKAVAFYFSGYTSFLTG